MENPNDYRPCIGIMLMNKDGKVFVAHRVDQTPDSPYWQMPQGGIDEGEDPEKAALRELAEEIGTNKADLVRTTKDWIFYDLPEDLQGRLWGGKYKGQRQLWTFMDFTGDDSDINIHTEIPEFTKWQWVSPEELVALAIPFKIEVYKTVIAEFANEIKKRKKQ